MKSFIVSVIAVFVSVCDISASAEETQKPDNPYTGIISAGACALKVHSDNTDPDFHNCGTFNLYAGYRFFNWLNIEAGYQRFLDSDTDRKTDMAGSYKTSLTSSTVFGGLGIHIPVSDTFIPYLRGGVLSYHSKLTVHEYFDDIYPDGKDSATDSGRGYYWAAGLSFYPEKKFRYVIEYQQQVLQDIFSGSNNPFDAHYESIMLGIGF